MSSTSLSKTTKWLEIAAAIILSVASVLTAWSSYQAAQWSRAMALAGGSVASTLLESTQLVILGSQDTTVDVITFTNWLEATSVENQALADFYRSRFREEFKPAFEAWLSLKPLDNPAAPSSPFAMEAYSPTHIIDAKALQDEAGQLQTFTRTASDNAAYYVRNTLFLAVALFLIGITRIFSEVRVRIALQVVAFGMLVISIVNLIIGEIA